MLTIVSLEKDDDSPCSCKQWTAPAVHRHSEHPELWKQKTKTDRRTH
uniref:Uncharacterized protein n=1 Tax=Anguilla anguilla TaxID=7936 RepID=A0A0E9S3J0_ANGAN